MVGLLIRSPSVTPKLSNRKVTSVSDLRTTWTSIKDNSAKYSDWALVGCYYASYHAALALLLQKGVSSKNHDATLCLLIKYYYQKDLTQEDFELLNFVYLDNQDILFYVESKQEREKASYSSQIEFDKKKISELVMKTVLFVNKCKEILTQK